MKYHANSKVKFFYFFIFWGQEEALKGKRKRAVEKETDWRWRVDLKQEEETLVDGPETERVNE